MEETKRNANQIEETKINANRMEETKKNANRIEETKINANRMEETKRNANRIEETKIYDNRIEETKRHANRIEETKTNANRAEETKKNANRIEETKKNANRIEETKKNANRIEETKKNANRIEEIKMITEGGNDTQITPASAQTMQFSNRRVMWHRYSTSEVLVLNERRVEDATPNDADLGMIRDALGKNLACKAMNAEEIKTLSHAMKLYQYGKGEFVVKQGEYGSHFFIVATGEFLVIVDEEIIKTLRRGQTFGELALLHNIPRSASVIALTAGKLWAVPRRTFREMMKLLGDRTFAERLEFVNSVSLFAPLPVKHKRLLASALVLEHFDAGVQIVQEGKYGNILYLVRSGSAQVSIGGKVISTVSETCSFGTRALLYREPRSATVTTLAPMSCYVLDRDTLKSTLGDLQQLLCKTVMMEALLTHEKFKLLTFAQLSRVVDAGVVRESLKGSVTLDDVFCAVVLLGKIGYEYGEYKIEIEKGGLFIPSAKAAVWAIEPTKLACWTNSAIQQCFFGYKLDERLQHNRIVKLIQLCPIFRRLSDAVLDRVAPVAALFEYTQGQLIVRAGEETFVAVQSGKVGLYDGGKLVRYLYAREFYNEAVLLGADAANVSCLCASYNATVLTLNRKAFDFVAPESVKQALTERSKLENVTATLEDLEVVRVIGYGTFGIVKLVRNRTSNEHYALKCISRQNIRKFNQQERLYQEKCILEKIDHPFVVRLVKTFKDAHWIYLLLELMTGGELYQIIRCLGLLGRPQAQFYIGTIILALEHLHEHGIIYRDLKPENVLVDYQGFPKLIDMGCAKQCADRTYTLIGTPHYSAPEVVLGKGYGFSADVWAVGICLYEFVCGPLPFGNDAEDQLEIFREILTKPLSFPVYVDDEDFKCLVSEILCRNPASRLGCGVNGIRELKKHRFFAGVDWDKLLARSCEVPYVPEFFCYGIDTAPVNFGLLKYNPQLNSSALALLEQVDSDPSLAESWDAAF